MVSEVVETDTVSEADGVVGLVTPLSVTRTESPAAIELPVFKKQVIVSPDGGLQAPRPLAPVVVSSTEEVNTDPRPVPDGNTNVISLPLDSEPLPEVVNVTTYTVRAPPAADGEELTTWTALTDDGAAERAGPITTSIAPSTDAATIQRQRRALPRPRRVSVAFTSPVFPSGPQRSPNSRRYLTRKLRRRLCLCPLSRVTAAACLPSTGCSHRPDGAGVSGTSRVSPTG